MQLAKQMFDWTNPACIQISIKNQTNFTLKLRHRAFGHLWSVPRVSTAFLHHSSFSPCAQILLHNFGTQGQGPLDDVWPHLEAPKNIHRVPWTIVVRNSEIRTSSVAFNDVFKRKLQTLFHTESNISCCVFSTDSKGHQPPPPPAQFQRNFQHGPHDTVSLHLILAFVCFLLIVRLADPSALFLSPLLQLHNTSVSNSTHIGHFLSTSEFHNLQKWTLAWSAHSCHSVAHEKHGGGVGRRQLDNTVFVLINCKALNFKTVAAQIWNCKEKAANGPKLEWFLIVKRLPHRSGIVKIIPARPQPLQTIEIWITHWPINVLLKYY